MADWKDNKDSGPWNFTEQPNKWGYLNNPRWSNRQDSINFCGGLNLEIGLSDEHAPCGHWHKAKTFPLTAGKWVAAMQQPDTPYIYLYDIEVRAVIRVNTAFVPPIVDGILRLNSTYDLDYDMGYGNPGTQRGAYCMNKDGTRIWYLFCDQGQYPIVRGHPDAELIEVNITSYYMKVVKRTLFPNLLPAEPFPGSNAGRVNDGCSDDTHTYWCTDLVAGRIIKIQNSDHSIVDDHYFNYPLECGHAGGGFNGPITTIDVNKSTRKLYWVYCRDHFLCIPAYNACRHLIRADLDLVGDIDNIVCGSGFSAPGWQNMIKIYSDYVLYHWGYHPFSSPLGKWSLDFSSDTIIHQEYLQNIFGVKDEKIFTLMHLSSISHPAFLYCIDFSGMNEISKLDVSYYAGQRYPDSYDWTWTSVSALNEQTGVIAIFRYNNIQKRNYAGCFSAIPSLEFLCDARFEQIYDDPTLGPFGEPQSWPFEGFTPPPIPSTDPPIQTTDPNPGPGEIPYVPPPPPDDAPDNVPVLQSGFVDGGIYVGPGQTIFFKMTGCTSTVQISNTPGSDQPCTVHLLIGKNQIPTITDFERTWLMSQGESGTGGFYWKYNTGTQAEFVEITGPVASDIYYIMLYNSGMRSVRNQCLTVYC